MIYKETALVSVCVHVYKRVEDLCVCMCLKIQKFLVATLLASVTPLLVVISKSAQAYLVIKESSCLHFRASPSGRN